MVGITGHRGFIGSHLINYLDAEPYSGQECDIIIHLAALNRNASDIYGTNMKLVSDLISSIKGTPHIIFASSIQEDKSTEFGRSKKDGRRRLASWCKFNKCKFTGLVIPNVFGPGCKPFYNSVVATFSHQLFHGNNPIIENDASLKLIYIDDLCKIISWIISEEITSDRYVVNHSFEMKVSDILNLLETFISYK